MTSKAESISPADEALDIPLRSVSARRISAMVLRHWYLLTGSWPRLLDLFYWPLVQMLLWGFIQSYLATARGVVAQAAGVLLGAALLWDVLFRSQVSLSIAFLEEIWSRNLGHLLVSPLRSGEFVASLVVVSLIRTLIGLACASLMAIALFGFSLYDIGLGLVAFFFNLSVFGWAVGIAVSALILRFGMGAEMLTWVLAAGLAPLCAVYYPIDVLPHWLQWLPHILPPAYIFEGMRGVLLHGVFRLDLLGAAVGLNVLYVTGGLALFMAMLKVARRRGMLLQLGE
jgi:ABC-2 type transport system permease protein